MSIPIIFVHKGYSSYMNYSLQQAHLFNPNSPIYLISDSKEQAFNFVTYINIADYQSQAIEFAKNYKHMSTNAFKHELFCFQRWFIVKEVVEKMQLNDFLYLDSDILLFCDINKVFEKKDYDFTVCNKIGPQYSYFTGKDKIIKFCDFLNQLYVLPEYVKRLNEKHQHHLSNNLPGGVCDMTAFSEYQFFKLGIVKDLSLIENESAFDDNINVSDGFEMSSLGIKNIVLENKNAFATKLDTGKKIKFNGLHFQGPGKIYMYRFYVGSGFKLQRLRESFLIFKRRVRRLFN